MATIVLLKTKDLFLELPHIRLIFKNGQLEWQRYVTFDQGGGWDRDIPYLNCRDMNSVYQFHLEMVQNVSRLNIAEIENPEWLDWSYFQKAVSEWDECEKKPVMSHETWNRERHMRL